MFEYLVVLPERWFLVRLFEQRGAGATGVLRGGAVPAVGGHGTDRPPPPSAT